MDQLDQPRRVGWLCVTDLRHGRRLRLGFGSSLQLRFPLRLRCGFGIVRGFATEFRRLALPRQHRDVERGAPVLRAKVAEIIFDLLGLRDGPLLVHSEDRLPFRVRQPDLAEAPLSRGAHARAYKLEPAVAGAFGELVETLVAHSVSSTWRISPTRPPTSVPLMRMYWRSRPTAASSRLVTV